MVGTLRFVCSTLLLVASVSLLAMALALMAHGRRATEDFSRYRLPDCRSERLLLCNGGLIATRSRTELDGNDRGEGWTEERHHYTEPPAEPRAFLDGPAQNDRGVRLPGVVARTSVDHGTMERAVLIPYWTLVLAGALLPARRLLLHLRRRGRRARQTARCVACGYDLRATPDVCPECGTPAGGGEGPPGAGVAKADWCSRLAAALGAAACLGAVAAGCLVAWWCDPRTPPIRNPKVASLCWYDGVWEPCRGTGPDRMSRTDAWGSSAYQALWRHDGHPLLIIIKRSRVEPRFGVRYTVDAFDRRMTLVGSGDLDLPAWESPYCLVEADDADQPGRWRLAVAGGRWARPQWSQALNTAGANSAGIEGESVLDNDPEAAGRLFVYEIEWSDRTDPSVRPPQAGGRKSGAVDLVPGLRVRSAEAADGDPGS